MSVKLLLLPGDGIGPECAAATAYILKTATGLFSLDIEADSANIGGAGVAEENDPLPPSTRDKLRAADIAVIGPLADAEGDPLCSDTAAHIARDLDLYARLTPVRTWSGFSGPIADLDMLIVSPVFEGADERLAMVAGSGAMMPAPDVALSVSVATRPGTRRIADTANRLATARGGPLALVYPADPMSLADNLFVSEVDADRQAGGVPILKRALADLLADLMSGAVPATVLVSPSASGATIGIAGTLAGTRPLTVSLLTNDRQAVSFVASGPRADIAGQGVSDPVPFILSVARALDWAGQIKGRQDLVDAAAAIEAGTEAALADPASRSADLGGGATTAQIAKSIATAMIAAVRATVSQAEDNAPD